jgi:hypothetical protein
LTFYEGGKLLKIYRVGDLVEDVPSLPRSMNGYMWQRDAELNSAQDVLVVTTHEGVEFRFDMTDGKMLSSSREHTPAFDAEIEDLAGNVQLLRDFRVKKGRSLQARLMMDGAAARRVLWGETDIRVDPETGATSSLGVGHSFRWIVRASLSSASNEHELYWSIDPRFGSPQEYRIQAHPGELIFEGRDASGRFVDVPAANIRRLDIKDPVWTYVYAGAILVALAIIGLGILVIYDTIHVLRNPVPTGLAKVGWVCGLWLLPVAAVPIYWVRHQKSARRP